MTRHDRPSDGRGQDPHSGEARLRAALRAHAEQHPVEAHRLLADVHARLAAPRPGADPRRRTGSRTLPLLVAAAVLAIIGGGAVLAQLVGSTGATTADLGATRRAPLHRVDTGFTCAETREVPLDGTQDEFVPDLRVLGDPEGVAREYDAPRYSFVVDGEAAVLRLGNADGTLGSRTQYRRVDGAWVMEESRACTVAAPPGSTTGGGPALRLGAGRDEPWPAPRGGDPGTRAVLLDDRPVVSHAGLRGDHRTLYAQPCGRTVCLYLTRQDGYVLHRLGDEDGVVVRVDEAMVDPDVAVGRPNPYQLWVAWDPAGDVGAVTGEVDGALVRAQVFTDATWDGARLHALLVPAGADAELGALGTAVSQRFGP